MYQRDNVAATRRTFPSLSVPLHTVYSSEKACELNLHLGKRILPSKEARPIKIRICILYTQKRKHLISFLRKRIELFLENPELNKYLIYNVLSNLEMMKQLAVSE